MQNENSASLRAGSTKTKNAAKPGFGSNVSKKGFGRLKAPMSGTKTSQSQADTGVVIVDGKVRTPKQLISKRYKLYTDEYLKLLDSKQQQERKNKQQYEIKPKSSLTSQNDSQMKQSSSMNQQKSFMSSNKSQAESQNEYKKQTTKAANKQQLTVEDLQAAVPLQLQQTPTVLTFYLPSTCYKQQNDDIKKTNVYYREYMQKRIGSDNYIPRPVQTFNFQHKKIVQSIDTTGINQEGVFASQWDIEDVMRLQKKTEYQVLQEEIKKNVDDQFGNYLLNPFSCLSLDKDFIEIHSKYEVPGAAQYILKEKELDKKARTRKVGGHTGQSNTQSGLAQISNVQQQIPQYDTKNQQNSSYRKQQSSQSGNRKGIKTAQLQMQLKQQQQKIQSEEKQLLESTFQHAKTLPSQSQQKLLKNESLETALKYIDRILNSQTYHKEFISYRNYPEVEFIKKVQEQDKRRNKKKEKQKEQVNKEPLQYLFSFKNRMFKNYIVTNADWNPINMDLLAVTYELDPKIAALDTKNNDKKGLLMFWTLKNPAFPEKIFTSQFPLTSCKFSLQNPNLVACGSQDGTVSIYDIRKKSNTPIAQNRQSLDKHTNAVWDIQWISKGKGGKGQTLVSISADGRITQWSMKKGLQCNDLMFLRRLPQNNKKQNVENMNFRFASGLSFEFLKGESSMYLATTQEGVIYRCSKSYTQQYLEVYTGHNGPVYKARANPFLYDVFLTCSADWSCKLWNWRKDQPLQTFQSLDLTDQVIDIEWSPNEATVFASVCKDGRVELWDLQKKNMLDPICIKKSKPNEKAIPKTIIRFCKGDPILITGDVGGNIDVFRINREQDHRDFEDHKSRLVKLLYPNGYVLGVNEQKKPKQEESQQHEKTQQTPSSNKIEELNQ